MMENAYIIGRITLNRTMAQFGRNAWFISLLTEVC